MLEQLTGEEHMGNLFQSVVDPEAIEAEAPALADRVLRWLIDEEVVVPERSDCILGEGGHGPGPLYVKATGTSDGHLLGLRTNGLEVVSTRTVFHNGGLGFDIVCLSCGGRFGPQNSLWGNAVDEWYERRGPGLLACPACKAMLTITEWRHDPPLGFANLGFTFWNWQRLTDSFVATIGARLGHRVIVVHGKL